MKLNENTKLVRRGGSFQEKEFTMAVNAQAFHVMSSTLYSNKIRAIIRELSCNAADAHVVAGNPNTPYLVHLPDNIDRSFRIRDFGTGLSKEQIDNVYTEYFNSTKTDTNDQVGCLGLGSKSPFAYTDNFSVVSYFNGEKYVYSSFKNEKGNPSIALISEGVTDEPNGLEVKFAVRSSDFYRFEDEARSVYKWFNLKPTFEGSRKPLIPKLEKSEEGKGWFVEGGSGGALMGNILYTIQPEHLKNYLKQDLVDILEILRPTLVFPLGTLEFQPSRENLSYEKRTIDSIQKRLEQIKKEFVEKYSDEISSSATKWDAFLLLQDISSGRAPSHRYLQKLIANGTKFLWNNQAIAAFDSKAEGFTAECYTKYDKFWFSYQWRNGNHTTKFRPIKRSEVHKPEENLLYVFVDVDNKRKYSSNAFRAWMRSYKQQYKDTTFKVISNEDFEDDSTFFDDLTEKLGMTLGVHCFWWHDMPKTISTRKGGGGGGHGIKRTDSKLLNFHINTYDPRSEHFKKYESIDLENGEGLFIERDKTETLYKGQATFHPGSIIKTFNQVCDKGSKIEKVHSLTPAQMKKKGPKWVNIFDHLKTEVPLLWTDEMQKSYWISKNVNNVFLSQLNVFQKLGLRMEEVHPGFLKKAKSAAKWAAIMKGVDGAKSYPVDFWNIAQLFNTVGRISGATPVNMNKAAVPATTKLVYDNLESFMSEIKGSYKLLAHIDNYSFRVYNDINNITKHKLWQEIRLSILFAEGLI